MTHTQLILLGTGTPNCAPDLSQAAYALVVNRQPYLIDCGGGTIQQIARMQATMPALAWPNLTRLFLTHLHPDHTAGLPDLIIAPWVLNRVELLRIFGPTGTNHLCTGILDAYKFGIGEHRDGLAPIDHPLQIEVTGIEGASVIYRDERVKVEAIPVSHGGLPAFGFKFTTVDKVVVFSGDTCPMPALIEAARDCDILVHEVYSAAGLLKVPPRWQKYHRTVHTSSLELAAIANEAQPKLLVLTHQLLWGDMTEADLMREITDNYAGKVVWGQDLDIFP